MSRYSATRGSSGPSTTTTRTSVIASDHAGLPHDGFGLAADLTRHVVRIALLEFRKEQLHRQRAGMPLLRQLPQDLHERGDAVAGNHARRLIEELARQVGHILKMHVA